MPRNESRTTDPFSGSLAFTALFAAVVFGAKHILEQNGYTEIFAEFAEANKIEPITVATTGSQIPTEYVRVEQEPYVTLSAEAKLGLSMAGIFTVIFGAHRVISGFRRSK